MIIILLRRVWGWIRKDQNTVVKMRYDLAVIHIELNTMRIKSCIAQINILISYTTNIKHTQIKYETINNEHKNEKNTKKNSRKKEKN